MPTTAAPPIPDDTSGVIAALCAEQLAIDAAEVRKLRLVVAWAAMHSTDTLANPTSPTPGWTEQPVTLAGPGSPAVAEFCVPEIAVALGTSHDAAACLLAEALELAHRLPRLYARVLAGDLRVWKARRIARSTLHLPQQAAAFVDTHAAATAHRIGGAALERLVTDALVRFDPTAAETNRLKSAEQRRFDIDLASAGPSGTVEVTGCLDTADALDLEHAVRAGATDLAALGSTESLDVRRSQAVGVLARRQLTLDLNPTTATETTGTESTGTAPRVKARQIVIHVHLGDGAVATVEGCGVVSTGQVQAWCSDPDTQVVVRPVIDLNATDTTSAYVVPDRMRDQVILRDRTCVFPGCGVSARRCDLDHLHPWAPDDAGGATTPANLAPLCRRHHRIKTHGGWTYTRTDTGDYLWTTPHGQAAEHRRA